MIVYMGYIQLRNYAEWYYTKYFPSVKMLHEKLKRKCEDPEIIQKVLNDLESMMIEKNIIESRVHDYVSQGKTTQYIRNKLREKKFQQDLVDIALEGESDTLKNPENFRPQITTALQKGEKKGSSKKALRYELRMKYPDAKEVIDELLGEYDDREVLVHILQSTQNTSSSTKASEDKKHKAHPPTLKLRRTRSTNFGPDKLVAKLAQKGFSISDIYAVLRR